MGREDDPVPTKYFKTLMSYGAKVDGYAPFDDSKELYSAQLSRKITGIEKIFKTWDLYQSILYTLEDYFLEKSKFFNPGFFFYRPICFFTL